MIPPYTILISSHLKHSRPSPAPQARYVQAKLSVHDRSLKVATVIESLEMEMELLCLTGVEDQLQTDVRPTLEILRNAGIKVWGVALSSNKLVKTKHRNKTYVFHIYLHEQKSSKCLLEV